MSDPEAADVEAVDTGAGSDPVEKDDQPRRPWYGFLIVVLLLLLLLCCGITAADLAITRGPDQARFVARNLACLQCHTELIPDFSRPVVHRPFALRECTLCHTPHGKQVTSIVTQGPRRSAQRFRALVQWLPLRLWFTAWDNLTGGSASASVIITGSGKVISKTTKDTQGGVSHLTMPEDKLCWTCHGSVGALLGDAVSAPALRAGAVRHLPQPACVGLSGAAHAGARHTLLHLSPHGRATQPHAGASPREGGLVHGLPQPPRIQQQGDPGRGAAGVVFPMPPVRRGPRRHARSASAVPQRQLHRLPRAARVRLHAATGAGSA